MGDIKPIETVYNGYRFRSRLEARWAVFFDALGVEYEYEPEGFELENGMYYLPDFKVKCYGTRGEITDKPFDLWIEVKGRMTNDDARKIMAFSGNGTRVFAHCPVYCEEKEMTLSPSSDYDDHIRRWECPWMGCGLFKDTSVLPGTVECDHVCEDKNTLVTILTMDCVERPILIVGNIPPHGCSSDSWATKAYENDNGIYPFNYELIDGDYFAAYPAAHKGKFFLWGDDSNYIWNVQEVERAYDVARQARFEHGETPTI